MLVAIDIETTCAVPSCPYHGKSPCHNGHTLDPWKSEIAVIAVASDKEVKTFRGSNLIADTAAYLQGLGGYTVTGHSFKFDWIHLARHGLGIPFSLWTDDSQLAAYVLTDKIPDEWLADYVRQAPPGARKASKHGLKTLAPYFLGVAPYWDTKAASYDDDEYVGKDASYTLDLTRALTTKLKERNQYDFYKKQLAYTKLLLEAELSGIVIDLQEVQEKKKVLQEKEHQLKKQLDEVWSKQHREYAAKLASECEQRYRMMAEKAGKPFEEGSRYHKLYEAALKKTPIEINYASPTQLIWLLRDSLKYDVMNLEGEESTEAEVLERLAFQGHKDVALLLEWRETNKILTTYLPTYEELAVLEHGNRIIHPTYNVASTRTGRTSSERPNMQNIPKDLRPLFKARKGKVFIGFDQAAIEARLIALYTNDIKLFDLVKNNISIHDNNTRVFFDRQDVQFKDVKKELADERSASKNVGFALFYHAGANRLRIAFAQKGFHFTLSECKQLHKRFLTEYSTAMSVAKEVVQLMEQGEVIENLCGRPLSIENPEDAYMKAFNKLIQSSASDLLLEGALRFKAKYPQAVPLLFVHDFVGFEVPEEQASDLASELARYLTDFNLTNELGRIPLEVEGGISKSWEGA